MRVLYASLAFAAVFIVVNISNRMRRKVYYGTLVVNKVEEYKDMTPIYLQEGKRVIGEFTSDDNVKFILSCEISDRQFKALKKGDKINCMAVKYGKKLEGYINDGPYPNLYLCE